MDNDKESIDQLFQDAIDAFGENVLPGTKALFEKLANITLKYRDELVAKGEAFLTVGEVKEALARQGAEPASGNEHGWVVGEGKLEACIRQRVAELKLDKYFRFVGIVPHAEAPEYYRQADIVVFPSSAESTSLACLEAMSAIKRSIATNPSSSPC